MSEYLNEDNLLWTKDGGFRPLLQDFVEVPELNTIPFSRDDVSVWIVGDQEMAKTIIIAEYERVSQVDIVMIKDGSLEKKGAMFPAAKWY